MRLKETNISDEQLRWFDDNKVEVAEDEYLLDENGNTIGLYLMHGFRLPWEDDETSDEILEELESDTQELVTHYPPPGRDKKDKRFQKDFEEDRTRCEEKGYPIGLYHLGFRRYVTSFVSCLILDNRLIYCDVERKEFPKAFLLLPKRQFRREGATDIKQSSDSSRALPL